MNLVYNHDTITFEGLTVDKLNNHQRGILEDYLDELPGVDELDDMREDQNKLEEMTKSLEAERKFLTSKEGKKELLSYTTEELFDYYKDFIDELLFG